MQYKTLNQLEYGIFAIGPSGKRIAARLQELDANSRFTWVVLDNRLWQQPCPLATECASRVPTVTLFEINHERDAKLVLQHLTQITTIYPLSICAGYFPLSIGGHASNSTVIDAARRIERSCSISLFINRDELWRRFRANTPVNDAIAQTDTHCAAMVLAALRTIKRHPKPLNEIPRGS